MPFLSDQSHQKLYVEPLGLVTDLNDVVLALGSILKLPVNQSLRKRLVKDCVWEVPRIHGDFRGRFRSSGVMTPNVKIQRDHVGQKSRIIERLLKGEESIETVLNNVIRCVVSEVEHNRLAAVSRENRSLDGWARYKAVEIVVLDMVSRQPYRY